LLVLLAAADRKEIFKCAIDVGADLKVKLVQHSVVGLWKRFLIGLPCGRR